MRHLILTGLLVGGFAVMVGAAGCGGGSSGTSSNDGTITTNDQALASIPSADPASLDYALSSNGSAMVLEALGVEEGKQAGSDLTIQIKIAHTAGTGLGNFKVYVCRDSSPAAYASLAVANDVYDASGVFKHDPFLGNITARVPAGLAITDANFVGSVLLKGRDSNSQVANLDITATGADSITKLAGGRQEQGGEGHVRCAWNSSLGCASFSGPLGSSGDLPFAITVASGSKSYSASSDASMCSNLPSALTLASPDDLPSDFWDCVIPSTPASNETKIDTSSLTAQQLEDAGGADCKARSDMYESMSQEAQSPGGCMPQDGPPSATQAGCFCDSLFGFGAQMYRQELMRRALCKAKGLFSDSIRTALGITLADNSVFYANLTITGGGGGGGGGGDLVDGCACTQLIANATQQGASQAAIAAFTACCSAGTSVEACLTNACSGEAQCLASVAQACPN